MTPPPLTTERLLLIPATLELADAELHNRMEFSHQLEAAVLEGWPPPPIDEGAMRAAVDYLRRHPEASGWTAWYWVAKKHKPVVVGRGGFKGLPAGGAVEIECSLLPMFQRKGFAAEAAAALLDWAFGHEEVDRVVAETSPERPPWVRLLEKSGFESFGRGSKEGPLRFERRRGARRP
ncbi:MAG: GNAT family N-acetyltransferase [Elusimicrobiota bacterium]